MFQNLFVVKNILFRNPLFFKVVFVFTLPALGMMYFSTILVYEKIEILNNLSYTKKNIKYVISAEKLIHSIQKERGFSLLYSSSKIYKDEMNKQRVLTNIYYKEFLKNTFTLSSNTIKSINDKFRKIELLRHNINNETTKPLNSLFEYNKINEELFNSIISLNPVKYASKFNSRLNSINNLLLAKEYAGIERALIAYIISNKYKTDEENYTYLIKLKSMQEFNLKNFLLKADLSEVNQYNKNVSIIDDEKIENIRMSINNNNINETTTVEEWWNLSTNKIDSFENIFIFTSKEIMDYSNNLEEDASFEKMLSMSFLLVSFLTLISLFFVLKNIIFNEQKSFNKISKQQKIYEILNKTNKFLITISSEEKLFKKICSLIVKDKDIPFAFVCKLDKELNINIISNEGVLKDNLNEFVEINNIEKKQTGLARKAYKQENNIIIDSLKEKNISALKDIALYHDLRSAAAFPVKKFGKIVAVIVLYSNKFKFFDKEVEILLNQMMGDITHSLEKFEYEKNKLEQENEIRIASYAFESKEPMLITNKKAITIKVNEAFCNISGFTKNEVIGNNPNIFKSGTYNKEFYEKMWSSIIKNGTWTGEIVNKKKNGEMIPLKTTITAIKNKNDVVMHYIAQYTDLTQEKRIQEELEYKATHDVLTGLPNRLLLFDRINQALLKVTRHNVFGGLLFIDLDNFKAMNDTLGHDIGDQLLIEVSLKLKQTIREEDTIARIGGDEFIILVGNIGIDKKESIANLTIFSNKIKDSLNSIKTVAGHKNMSTPSIGVTLFGEEKMDVNEIIKQADLAMYEAKKAGKNSIKFFEVFKN